MDLTVVGEPGTARYIEKPAEMYVPPISALVVGRRPGLWVFPAGGLGRRKGEKIFVKDVWFSWRKPR
jgi:hypothetical protein